jgi:hypothetical protein
MATVKKVFFDFFTVDMPKRAKGTTFADVLTNISTLPNDESRNQELDGGVYRLAKYRYRTANDIHEGEVVRIRMDNLPTKAKLNGNESSLDLDDDEGIGEQTAFVYEPQKKTLVLQRNRFGVSVGAFLQYFNQSADLSGSIRLLPKLSGDAMKRLASVSAVSRFEFAVSAPSDTSFLKNQGYSVSQLQKLVDYFGAPAVSVAVTRGHSQSWPHTQKVVEAVKDLFGITATKNGRVTKLKLEGETDDGEAEAINFLVDQISESAELRSEGKDRLIPYGRRINAIKEALERRGREL